MRLLCDGMLETKKPADRLIRGRMLRVSSLTSAQLPDAVANELHQLQPVLGQGKRKDKVAVEFGPNRLLHPLTEVGGTRCCRLGHALPVVV